MEQVIKQKLAKIESMIISAKLSLGVAEAEFKEVSAIVTMREKQELAQKKEKESKLALTTKEK